LFPAHALERRPHHENPVRDLAPEVRRLAPLVRGALGVVRGAPPVVRFPTPLLPPLS